MESDQRYFWRRAAEEYYAAERAMTAAGRARRRELAEQYVRRLRDSGVSFEMPNVPGAGMLPAETARAVEARVEWPLPKAIPAVASLSGSQSVLLPA